MEKVWDWSALKSEFVTGEWTSLSDFAKKKDIPYNSLLNHSGGWLDARVAHRNEITMAAESEDQESKIISARQLRVYMSGVTAGVLQQWQRMNDQLTIAERLLQETGDDLTPAVRNRLRRDFGSVTRLLPEILKVNELLEGRATERAAVDEDESLKAQRKDMEEEFRKMQKKFQDLEEPKTIIDAEIEEES